MEVEVGCERKSCGAGGPPSLKLWRTAVALANAGQARRVVALAMTLGLVWAVALSAASHTSQATTNDGIYSKAQADAAKAQFDKLCASCHAFTVAEKRKPEDLPLGDEPFIKAWEGKPVIELVSLIEFTMPNDGSAIVTGEEALNLVAYVLQRNGYPAGEAPLTKERADAVLARKK